MASVFFWTDKSLASPICDLLQLPESIQAHLSMTASDYIVDGGWNLPD